MAKTLHQCFTLNKEVSEQGMFFASITHFDRESELKQCFALKTTVHLVRLTYFEFQTSFPRNEKLHGILNFGSFVGSPSTELDLANFPSVDLRRLRSDLLNPNLKAKNQLFCD